VALITISLVSISLTYASLQSTESRLQLAAIQELRKQISDETGDTAIAVGSSLDAIRKRLETAASSPLLQQDDDQMRALLDATQVGIQYEGRINYLDSNGIVVYTTDHEVIGSMGSDRSDIVYYKEVKEKRQPIFTGLFKSSDNRNSLAIAVPILDNNGSFDGVLAAILFVDSLTSEASGGATLTETDQLFIIARDGTIIGHENESVVGVNMIDEFSAADDDIVSRNLQLMTEGKSGVFEYADQDGQRKIAAYSPLVFSGNIQAWSILIASSPSQSDTFASVLSDQRIFTVVAILLIAIIAAIFVAFILTLNKSLHKTVQKQGVQIKSQFQHLQEAYERLSEQDKIKDEFINIAAHELRTPVLPIILSAEGLAEELGTSNSKIDIIVRNAKRINKLTNDILDVSRIKSNTFRLQKDKINIRELVEEVTRDTTFRIAESNPKLTITCDSKLSKDKEDITADRGRINQVLSNLLDNSVNFTDQGTITVTIQHVNKWPGFIEIRVADTGKGIDPSIRPRLFEKFVTRSEKAKGTGLGLYLCKAIVEAHGGKIWGEDNIGGGAVFAFTLATSS
jgi:signal transduction histidine kinase